MEDLTAFSAKPRLRLLLDHFAKITDSRQAWKVAYPLREVPFLGLRDHRDTCVESLRDRGASWKRSPIWRAGQGKTRLILAGILTAIAPGGMFCRTTA